MTSPPRSSTRRELDGSTARILRRALLAQLRTAPGVDLAVAFAVAVTLRRVCGSKVSAADARRTLPTLRPMGRFDPITLSSDETADAFGELDDDAGVFQIEAVLPKPEEIGQRFWSSIGFAMYPYVIDVHSGSRPDHFEVHLLSDGRHDWWYSVPVSNYGDGWEIGEPTNASRAARRRELATTIDTADFAVDDPAEVHTSLTGPDFRWIADRAARAGMRARYRNGRLKALDQPHPVLTLRR